MSGEAFFKSGLDNSQLKRDVNQASNIMQGLGDKVQSESKKMDSSFSQIGKGLAFVGGTAAITMLGKQILDTTAKFEKFGIVLKNTLGDVKGQESLDMIAQFAATTPFQLDEVTGAFIKMANQGFVPTREEMVMLGDVASSTGKSFDQLTEALLDAQTGQFERLKEFGIKASANGDKVTFSFKEQQTTVDNTNSAIQAYILSLGELNGVQGANAKISASLTGQLSNLEDKLAAMYNQIGSANSGVFYTGLGIVSDLIENYETVGKVVLGLVAVYGAYKTAVMVANAVSVLQREIAVQQMLANIGNTGATIQLTTAQGLQAVMVSNLTRIQLALNKSMLANPYVLAAMAITGLVIAMTAYASSVKDAVTEKEILNDLEEKSNKNTKSEISNLNSLKKILNDSNKSYNEKKVALDKIQEIVPDYHASLTSEGTLINNNSDALDNYVKKLVVAEKLKLAASKQSEADKAFNDFKDENKDVLRTALKKKANGEELFAGEAGAYNTWVRLGQEATNYGKIIQTLQEELVSIDAVKVVGPHVETEAEKKARLAKEESERKAQESKLSQFQKAQVEAKKNADKAELDLLRSKITDKKDLIDLDYEQTMDAIEEEEKLFKEKAKAAGVNNPDLSSFTAQRTTAGNKRVSDKLLVDKEDVEAEKKKLEDIKREFETFQQERLRITKEYDDKIKLVGVNSEEGLQGAKLRDNALLALDIAFAEKEKSYKDFLESISKAGVEDLKKQLTIAQTLIESGSGTDEEKAILRAEIEALKKQIELVQKSKDSDPSKKWGDTLRVMNDVNESIENMIGSFDGMDEATKSALSAASNIAGAVIAGITGIISLSVVGAEAIKGVERASVILAVIGAAISVLTIIINLFTAAEKKRKEAEEAAIERQRNEYLGLVEYNEELRNKYEWTIKIGEAQLEYLSRTGAELKKQSDANAKEQADLWAKLQKEKSVDNRIVKVGIFGKEEYRDVYTSLAGKTYEEISQLAAQGKLSKEGQAYYEALKKAKAEGDDLAKRQEEYLQEVKETFTGTTQQNITDSIIEGFKQGKRSAADFADTFESLMQKAVQSALRQMTDKKVTEWYDEFAEMSENGLTPEEQAILQDKWNKLIAETAANTANIEATTGVSITDIGATRQATSKGFASMSQDSANELNGRFTALQGHTFNIQEGMKILQANSTQALKHLAGIETNTARLEAVENGINSVKQGISEINTKGIYIKV